MRWCPNPVEKFKGRQFSADSARIKQVQSEEGAGPRCRLGSLVFVAGVTLPSSKWVIAADDWLTTVGFLAMIGVAVLTWPRTIVLDSRGATELLCGGLRRRTAKWADVMHAIRIETDEELEVQLILKTRQAIKHTKLHVDRDRFIREVSQHVEVLGGPPESCSVRCARRTSRMRLSGMWRLFRAPTPSLYATVIL